MDYVLKLRELRRMKKLSQKEAADLSGVGEKSISSFETGQRIDAMKISQLHRLLETYGVTVREFFSDALDQRFAPWEFDETRIASDKVLGDLRSLPMSIQKNLLGKFQLMLDTASEIHAMDEKENNSFSMADETEAAWQMLTSRN